MEVRTCLAFGVMDIDLEIFVSYLLRLSYEEEHVDAQHSH